MEAFQGMVPMSRTVKWLAGINVVVWFFGILLVRLFFHSEILTQVFALYPDAVIYHFHAWQPVTYMFLHADIMHLLLNMLVLWWFGSELEMQWGRRFFLSYYFVSGVGAAIIYLIGVVIYKSWTGDFTPILTPVVGASGAIYGLILAYGIVFSERMIFFMMLFPMKAKHFVWVMGLVEFATLADGGFSTQVANLAHLGGIAAGYLYLQFWTKWRFRFQGSGVVRRGRKLKLVVNNEKDSPRYWN